MLIPVALATLIVLVLLLTLALLFRTKSTDDLIRKLHQESNEKLIDRIHQNLLEQQKSLAEFKETIQENFSKTRERFDQQQINSLKLLQEGLHKSMASYGELISKSVEKLTLQTD